MKRSSKRFILSDESVNLYGFKVITNGIQLDDFKLNPVCLYNHDYSKLLGLWTDLQVEGSRLTGVPEFDEEDPEAMLYFGKVEQGILKGASIGITPIQFDEGSQTMLKSALKETSLTPVPANKSAIALYSLSGNKLQVSEVKNYLLSVGSQISTFTAPLTGSIDLKAKIEAAILKNPKLSAAKNSLLYIAEHTPHQLSGLLARYENSYQPGNNIVPFTRPEPVVLSASGHPLNTFDDYAIHAPKELELMQRNDPAKFHRLTAAKVAAVRMTGLVVGDSPDHYNGQQSGHVSHNISASGHPLNTYDDYALHAPKQLELMQTNDPAKYQRLLNAKIAAVRMTGLVASDGLDNYNGQQSGFATHNMSASGHPLNTYDDYALHAPKQLELMERNDPAKFQQLLSAKIAAVRMTGKIAKD